MLPFNEKMFTAFQKSYDETNVASSKYWQSYVDIIVGEIKEDGLDGFGTSYNLTKGFGDAMSFPRRPKIRRLLIFPFLYIPVEKYLAQRNQNRTSMSVFANVKDFFSQGEFIDRVTRELSPVTKELGINRYNNVNGSNIPWRYMQAIGYIELLSSRLGWGDEAPTIEQLFDGNTMDIGGGYGPFVDALSMFKTTSNVGCKSTNYLLDQFPVSFIANQYLTYRYGSDVLPPVLNVDDLKRTDTGKDGQSFRVIQNTSAKDIKGLDIKFFFNSASFQEMDVQQVKEYVHFIKNNCNELSYLACFYYPSGKDSNSLAPSLEIFNKEFKALGQKSFDLKGFVKGTMYLFRIVDM